MSQNIIRLREIMTIAKMLDWIEPSKTESEYPIMQLSEVEKCMLAMVDDNELAKLRKWYDTEKEIKLSKSKRITNALQEKKKS